MVTPSRSSAGRRLHRRLAQLRPRRDRALFTDDVAYAYHPYDEPLEARPSRVVARAPGRAGLLGGAYAPALIAGDARSPPASRATPTARSSRTSSSSSSPPTAAARGSSSGTCRTRRTDRPQLPWGAGIRTPIPGTKNRCLAIRRPPKGVLRRRRYYDAPRARSHRADPRRRRGHAHAVRDLPKVLHPLCGRPMIEWPIAAAREAGAGRVVVVDGPKRALDGALPDGVEIAIQEEPNGTGDAVRSAADHIGDGRHRARPLRRRAADHRRGDHRARAARTRRAAPRPRWRRWSSRTRAATAAWCARPTAASSAWSRPRSPATPRRRRRRSARSTRASTRSRGGDLLGALESLTSDNAQGELYLPDVLPLLRADGKDVGAHVVTDPTLTLGVNNRVELAARAPARPGAHPPRATRSPG